MSKELSLVLDDGIARLFMDGHPVAIDPDTLGHLAEWIAVAWENVAGEQYKPVIISERGYVADAGYATTRNMVGNGRDAIAARAEALASTYDDGNGLERDCE